MFIISWYKNAFNVYCRELAPGTVSLTGDRAQGDDSKHCANSSIILKHAELHIGKIFKSNIILITKCLNLN